LLIEEDSVAPKDLGDETHINQYYSVCIYALEARRDI
jgi:hypothetical protein